MKFHEPSKTILYSKYEEVPDHLVFDQLGDWKAVKFTYGNALVLAAAGLDVPSPMLRYDWPSRPGEEPNVGQRETATHMVLHPRSFVFSAMRTGKSRSALWACDWLMSRSKTRIRTIIVSDLLALEETWGPETLRCLLGRRTFAVLHGTAIQRERELAKDVDFYLINHDGLRVGYDKNPSKCRGLARALLNRHDIKLAVFDEAASYRNRATANFGAALRLVSRRSSFVWALTGTPTPNGPLDAYGIKKLVHPDFSLAYSSWKDMVTYAKGPFKREPKHNADKLVAELLSPAVRVSQDSVFRGTDCKIETVKAPLSEQQRKYMKMLQTELVAMLENETEIPAVNQAALRFKLIQIACGVVYDEEHQSHFVDAAPRLEAFDKLINETEGKIIVFSPLTSTVNMLHTRLGSQSLIIRSEMSRKQKIEVLQEFQRGNSTICRVLNSHPGPIARGLDLTTASTIIWYAPIDRTEQYIQANQRINGPAQKNVRHIYRMSGSSIEDEIYARLENNEALQGAILKLKELRL
ncbi:MAG: DEAD/DEAH box helicase [Nitrososphaera sp.]|nr:DEAD/DEAH box helicase [Nitrososphaera sp.]